jgi:hypothetical protein
MPVQKFTKIPVEIEAIQLTWENWSDVCEFVPRPWFQNGVYLDQNNNITELGSMGMSANDRIGLKMQTLESQEFLAIENDWIIKGVNGEFYPCKPDIFEKTYRKSGD